MVESERYIDGKTTTDIRYFISSLTADAKVFSNAVRKHWAIESAPQAHEKEVHDFYELRACA
jgi:predicted transposase YbfD/YdcC